MDDTTKKEKELLGFIQEKKVVIIRDCISHSELPKSTINLMLKNMVDSGLLLREGSSRNVTYSASKKAVDVIKSNSQPQTPLSAQAGIQQRSHNQTDKSMGGPQRGQPTGAVRCPPPA